MKAKKLFPLVPRTPKSPDFGRGELERDEIHHGCCTAKGRGLVTGVMVIRRDRPKHRQFEVRMRIHAAWGDEFAFRIHDFRIGMTKIFTDLSDCFTATPDFAPYQALHVDKRLFVPANAREPLNPEPSPRMDDPQVLREQHR